MLQIIQNGSEVPPGSITGHLATPHIIHHPYCDGLLPKLVDISALIVLGGAMGAHDDSKYPFLSDLKSLIKTVVESKIPYLGICLGGQLLAASMGAKVESCRWEEFGHYSASLTAQGADDRLFKGIANEFDVFQWHHDSFDIPPDAVLLASSALCPHQAFRIGASAWGVQFHPEVTEDIIRCWSAWNKSTSGRVEELVTEFEVRSESYRATVGQMIGNFLSTVKL
ncbi:MAG: type 1 glutamine amidotransferase [Geobacteraceae bacterium]|nr:type 1 glutamine amidotransferase [Geobacteraceae bacterium]